MLFGLIIDITKAPGYLLGAIYQLFNFRIKKGITLIKFIFSPNIHHYQQV